MVRVGRDLIDDLRALIREWDGRIEELYERERRVLHEHRGKVIGYDTWREIDRCDGEARGISDCLIGLARTLQRHGVSVDGD